MNKVKNEAVTDITNQWHKPLGKRGNKLAKNNPKYTGLLGDLEWAGELSKVTSSGLMEKKKKEEETTCEKTMRLKDKAS